MKKILYVANVDWYFCLHWVERASYFKGKGFDIHVATTITDPACLEKLSLAGFTVHEFPLTRSSLNPFKEFFSIINLYQLIDRIQPDLIHTITIKPNIYVGLLNKIFFQLPIVYAITGIGAVYSSNALKFRISKFISTRLYKFISISRCKFIFENNDDYSLFAQLLILKKNGQVIPGAGIDVNLYSYSSQTNFNSILFASRLLRDKGLNILVDAVSRLHSIGVQCDLKVAGIIDDDVSSAIPLSEIESLHAEGKITWLGQVSDMKSLIDSCAIVCLPTTYGEGVPRILIEAASCGRAIVATDVSGCREIISEGNNGYLVPTGDSKSLSAAIESLLSDKEKMVDFGRFGRELVKSTYSQELVFDKTERVYRDLGLY